MKSAVRSRWKLLGGCFLVAIAWQYLYANYLVAPYFASSPPRWLRRFHFWMPDTLSVRLLNALGFRFDIANYDGNTGFVLASAAIESLIWAALFYVVALGVVSLRKAGHEAAAA